MNHLLNHLLVLSSLCAGAAALSVDTVGAGLRRRDFGAAAAAAIGVVALPKSSSAATAAADVYALGAEAKALRAALHDDKAGAQAAATKAQASVLRPLQAAMLEQAPSDAAKARAQEMKGHLLEFEYFVSKSDFAPYTSKTTGDTYPGGKPERELEEVAETFDEYVALLPSVFDGTFSDPNHPNGFRRISVKKGVATIVGKDEPQDKKEWKLKASVTPGTREMLVDFSPKGGPKDLLAKWSPTKNGIEFPDGNVWPKQ